jgi:hypothetical protein
MRDASELGVVSRLGDWYENGDRIAFVRSFVVVESFVVSSRLRVALDPWLAVPKEVKSRAARRGRRRDVQKRKVSALTSVVTARRALGRARTPEAP